MAQFPLFKCCKGALLRLNYEGSRRTYSGISMVDQMIDYAYSSYKGDSPSHDVASDVLGSGLNIPGLSPPDVARLHICRAEVESDRGRWKSAAQSSLEGLSAVKNEAPRLELLSAILAVRALLVQGGKNEQEALKIAMRYSNIGSRALLLQALVYTSSSELDLMQQLAWELVRDLDGSSDLDSTVMTNAPSSVIANSQIQDSFDRLVSQLALAAWQAQSGRFKAASIRFGLAAEAAIEARKDPNATAYTGVPLSVLAEIEAEGYIGKAQAQCLVEAEFSAMEETLGQALSAAEAAGSKGPRSQGNTRLVATLTLIGYTYARSARVTFAEGIFRKAAALINLDIQHLLNALTASEIGHIRRKLEATKATKPSKISADGSNKEATMEEQDDAALEAAAVAAATNQLVLNSEGSGVHLSLAAALGWRFFQLLSALPNRGNEAKAWEIAARALWERCGNGAFKLEDTFGDSQHLLGKGPKPEFETLISLWCRKIILKTK